MSTASLRSLIVDYLEEGRLMQLATVKDGRPWVCSVWYAYDDELNLYWFSSTTRRHSMEVETDHRVAGAIALPHTPEEPPRGLQFEGAGEVLVTEDDVAQARNRYSGRIFTDARIDSFLNHQERPHRFYRLRPDTFVLFDAVNYPDDPRQELKMSIGTTEPANTNGPTK